MFDLSPNAGMVQTHLSARSRLRTFCAIEGWDIDKLRGSWRFRSLVKARARAARMLRDAGMSLPEIGRALNRHHSTVINLLRMAP